MNYNIPPDLLRQMEEFEGTVDWSEVAAAAFAEFIAKNRILRNPNDFEATVERLRASKRRFKETASEYWKATGRRWAKLDADFVQLMRLSAAYVRDAQVEGWPIFEDHLLTAGQQLCEIIEPGSDLHPDQIFGEQWSEFDRNPAAVKAFCDGAVEVFHSVKERL